MVQQNNINFDFHYLDNFQFYNFMTPDSFRISHDNLKKNKKKKTLTNFVVQENINKLSAGLRFYTVCNHKIFNII